MTIQTVGIGAAPNDNTGDTPRSGIAKLNANFTDTANAASKLVQTSNADTTSGKVMLSDYAWRGAQLGDYFTYGGTANAITLTSANLAAGGTLIAGMKFRFKATTANTGATTIAVDGGSTISCVTPTGVALPADFIRTDVFTECEYDGANFVVSRKVESDSNANGEWTKWEDGRLLCSNQSSSSYTTNAALGSGYVNNGETFTFPLGFIAEPVVSPTLKNGSGGAASGGYVFGLSTTSVTIGGTGFVNTQTFSPGYNATGKWY